MTETDPATDDTDALKNRIAELEEDLRKAKKTSWWGFDSWQNSIKTISVPIALIFAGLTFYDQIVLGFFGKDSASVARVAANIEELQAMDQQRWRMEASGDNVGAHASEAAIIARRERLIAETYEHWQRHPSYFRPPELQILIHYLNLQNRTNDALEVFQTYWPTLQGPFAKAGGKLLQARIHAQSGPVQDLDAARNFLGEALGEAAGIPAPADRIMMEGQIVTMQTIVEMTRAGDCGAARPYLEELERLAPRDINGILAMSAEDMRKEFDLLCAS